MISTKNYILLENIRSCYNVGNIIRTADALGWDVILTGYTPSPFSQSKVKKTSLGAEESVSIMEFITMQAAIKYLHEHDYHVIAAEVTSDAIDLDMYIHKYQTYKNIAVILGNEIAGVEYDTLQLVDSVVKISMQGKKESLNVGQTAAIFMWALKK